MTAKNGTTVGVSEPEQRLRVSATSCITVHGGTVIRPGDMVEYDSRMCRVVEVYPEKEKLKVYKTAAFHSSVESIRAEAVTGYTSREDHNGT